MGRQMLGHRNPCPPGDEIVQRDVGGHLGRPVADDSTLDQARRGQIGSGTDQHVADGPLERRAGSGERVAGDPPDLRRLTPPDATVGVLDGDDDRLVTASEDVFSTDRYTA